MNPPSSTRPGHAPAMGDVNAQILAAYTGGLAANTQPNQVQTNPVPQAGASGVLLPNQTQTQPQMQQLTGTAQAQYWQSAQPQAQFQLMPQVVVPSGGLGTYPFAAQWYPQVQMAIAQLAAAQNMQLQAAMSCVPPNVQMVPQQAQFTAPFPGQHVAQAGPNGQTQARGIRSMPVGSVADDEARLLDALKTFRARRLSVRRAIEQLDGVNAHSASDWKDYFLDHLDRFHHLVEPRRQDPHSEKHVPSRSRSSSRESHSDGDTRRDSSRRQSEKIMRRPFVPQDSHTRRSASSSPEDVSSRLRRVLSDGTTHRGDTTHQDGPHDSASPASILPTSGTTRRTRGEPVAEFHAGTLIPPSSDLVKPRAPSRDAAEDDGSRFTDADHRFFIAFLRWKVARQPNVKKQELYAALAAETPYRNAEAWKRHWDNNPRMPDAIYIEASKRCVEPRDDTFSREERSPDSSGAYASESENEVEGTSSVAKSTIPKSKRGVAKTAQKRGPQKVTDDDFRAMAKYRYERMDIWHTLSGKLNRWREFAQRPQNAAKRSLEAWASIERDRKDTLEFYYDEYRRAQERIVLMPRPALPRRQGAKLVGPSTVATVAADPSTSTTVSGGAQIGVSQVRQAPAESIGGNDESVARDGSASTDKTQVQEQGDPVEGPGGPTYTLPRKRAIELVEDTTADWDGPMHKRPK